MGFFITWILGCFPVMKEMNSDVFSDTQGGVFGRGFFLMRSSGYIYIYIYIYIYVNV